MFCFHTNFAVFKIEICGTLYKPYLNEDESLHTPAFYKKMNHFIIAFHMTCNKWQRFQSLRSSFLGARFFPGPGCGFRSGSQTMSILMNEDNCCSPKVTTEIITT